MLMDLSGELKLKLLEKSTQGGAGLSPRRPLFISRVKPIVLIDFFLTYVHNVPMLTQAVIFS